MKIFYTVCVAISFCACTISSPTKIPELIPYPNHIETGNGTYQLPEDPIIYCNDSLLLPAVAFLQRGLLSKAKTEMHNEAGDITLRLVANSNARGSYRLQITQKGILLQAGDYGGIISAIATLRQLLSLTSEAKLPVLDIEDAPRFEWRGFMLDVSRHFYTKEEVMLLLDCLAQYKFNKFHWHLTDDQGWRIEIKRYPELTEHGAWREYEQHNNDITCMKLAAETGDESMLLPKDRCKTLNGKKLYGGYYSQEDIREVVAYAADLGIDVIPELDMPGHSLKVIESHPELSCKGQAVWGEVFSVPLCLGNDATLEFCKNVYSEVFKLFPFEYVHLGADEVEHSHWHDCNKCRQRMTDNHLKDEYELQAWFVGKMEDYFKANNKTLIGWDEITSGNLSSTTVVEWWRAWKPNSLDKALNNGNRVIMCPGEYLYLDGKQNRTSLKKVYGFEPISADKEIFADQILGINANLWAEFIPSFDQACFRIFPRLWAVSEIAWTMPDYKDESSFLERSLKHMEFLDAQGWNYRLPDFDGFYDSNVFIDTAYVRITSPTEHCLIRYTTDGTLPDSTSSIYSTPIKIAKDCTLKVRGYTTGGKAGEVSSAAYRKTDYLPSCRTSAPAGNGLIAYWYDYSGERCDEIETAVYKGEFPIPFVCIPKDVSGNIGLIIKGFITVPSDDIYTFYTYSDDGSILSINDAVVVNNDGAHSRQERTGQVALRKGTHKFELRYFDSNGGVLEAGMIDDSEKRLPLNKKMLSH